MCVLSAVRQLFHGGPFDSDGGPESTPTAFPTEPCLHSGTGARAAPAARQRSAVVGHNASRSRRRARTRICSGYSGVAPSAA